ncbi:MAG: hypothetical protein RO469_01195 [Thermincola sp.]|nr:hypothetical protein [Thermincola sp.]MDT3702910.1 hypothetical protein [Thermincola sp.]
MKKLILYALYPLISGLLAIITVGIFYGVDMVKFEGADHIFSLAAFISLLFLILVGISTLITMELKGVVLPLIVRSVIIIVGSIILVFTLGSSSDESGATSFGVAVLMIILQSYLECNNYRSHRNKKEQ